MRVTLWNGMNGAGNAMQDRPPRPFALGSLAIGLALGLMTALPAVAQETPALQTAYPAALSAIATGFDALRNQSDEALRAEFADYAAIGARMLRTDLNWHIVQDAGPFVYDWSQMDRVVRLAREAGLEVLPVVGSVPHWARKEPGERSAIANPANYARFLERAVERYAPMGIRQWEIWNEPNLDGPWPRPDAVAYAALLKAAYPAIKKIDPEATVISGGLASVVDTGPLFGPVQHISAVDFVETLYAEGAGDSFDALGFHPYTYPLLPGDPAGWSGWNLMTGPVRAVMVANGDAEKRIWITEYGAPSNGGKGAVSEQAQADMLVEARGLAAGLSYAGPLFWYSYRDLGTDPEEKEDWFGLRRADGTPKPAYAAFGNLPEAQR